MVDAGVNECDNTINGRNQFVFLVFVHLLLIGLNGTNGKYYFFICFCFQLWLRIIVDKYCAIK